MPELTYSDIDDEGGPIGPPKRPKWMTPKNSLAIAMLHSVDRMYYETRTEQSEVNEIVRQATSLTNGLESAYPLEWVEDRCKTARWMRQNKKMVGLDGLITMIKNTEKKRKFLDKWYQEHKDDKTNYLEKPKPAAWGEDEY